MSDAVLYEVESGVARITLNRPETMNALSLAAKTGLLDALRTAADSDVRAVVLTGAGERAFCVGEDLRELRTQYESGTPDLADTVTSYYNPIVRQIAGMPKPTVACVNGMAAGAGAAFAFACDFRIAADTAAFLTAFARIGLSGDSGISWTLQRLVGFGKATELMLLAEPVPAPSALELGLVHRVVPAAEVRAQAQAFAARLATGPTQSYAAIKQALAFGATHSLDETLDYEGELQARCGRSADHQGAVHAFFAKQPFMFQGR